MKDIILKHALLNAQQYDGKASIGSVLGKVLAENPALKKDVPKVKAEIEKTVEQVNSWSLEKQKKELAKLGDVSRPEKEQRVGLPLLDNAVKGKVVMRMAPNPNGPLHIGHVRPALLNDEYVKMYKGKFILRFDDTDPKGKRPMKEAYDWIRESLQWLGVKIHKETKASERLPVYYRYFEKLLEMGKAYICNCNPVHWRELKARGEACPCRDLSESSAGERWKEMLKDAEEGSMVARVKTDINHPDPAARDFAAFRIIDEPNHPVTKNKYRVWPMLDFASAIDDHEFGVTHIIRGVDLMISEIRQKFVYDYFGWDYPVTRTNGKLLVEGAVLSKSKILEGIRSGMYSGWDDPRLPTLSALKRRGFSAEAIRDYIVEVGANPINVILDWKALESHNRKVIDKDSNRYFFVAEPVEITLSKVPMKSAKAPLYPGKRKYRRIPVGKKLVVDRIDFVANRGRETRLMHLCNVKLDKAAKFTGKSVKDIPKIHWLDGKTLKAKLVMPDGKVVSGLAEINLKKAKAGETVQLERIGFARVDSNKKELVMYYAHR